MDRIWSVREDRGWSDRWLWAWTTRRMELPLNEVGNSVERTSFFGRGFLRDILVIKIFRICINHNSSSYLIWTSPLLSALACFRLEGGWGQQWGRGHGQLWISFPTVVLLFYPGPQQVVSALFPGQEGTEKSHWQVPHEGALWGRQTPKARSSSYGPFLESLRNSHAGLFDDSSSDPGHVPPLTAILDCSLLSFRPPLCWDLMAAKDRIQEGSKTCIWSIRAIQLLPCPQRECHPH